MLTRKILIALWFASTPTLALAHPGHGATDADSPAHYLVSFEHAAPLVAVSLIAAAIALGLRSRRRTRAV